MCAQRQKLLKTAILNVVKKISTNPKRSDGANSLSSLSGPPAQSGTTLRWLYSAPGAAITGQHCPVTELVRIYANHALTLQRGSNAELSNPTHRCQAMLDAFHPGRF
jgi:hypothetical protein